MSKAKVVFLNGPPGCGKDTAAGILKHATARVVVPVKFAEPLKAMTHRLYGLGEMWAPTEQEKDSPCEQFYGITPRQAYIAVSEVLMKPLHGRDFFGKLLLRHINSHPFASSFAVSDSGFHAEAVPIIEALGVERCLLVRMRRHGRSFANDSRSYWSHPGLQVIEVKNDGDMADLRRVLQPVIDWMEAS